MCSAGLPASADSPHSAPASHAGHGRPVCIAAYTRQSVHGTKEYVYTTLVCSAWPR